MNFKPEDFDMEAELHRYAQILMENYDRFNWDWSDNPEERERIFWKRIEDWRNHMLERLDNARTCMTKMDQLSSEHNYRYPEITNDNWRDYGWQREPKNHIWDMGTPQLLLGVENGPIEFHPDCPWDPRIWSHQTAGYMCHHPKLHGVVLPLSDWGYRVSNELSKKYVDSLMTPGEVPFDRLQEYRADLQENGLDCNYSYMELQEGWYPVDLNYLPRLVDTKIDGEVHEWITATIAPEGETSIGTTTFSWPYRWKLVICGENCD